MIESFQLTLHPTPSEVSRARRFVTQIAQEIGQDELADSVELLTSELVTNAILHGGGSSLRIAAAWSPPTFRVEVFDQSHAEPQPSDFGPEAATGRGLYLVNELASRWGSTPVDSGKSVWFEMLAEAG